MKTLESNPRYAWLPRIMDAPAAATYLGISKKTLERYQAAGKIEPMRFESPDSEERMLDKVVFDRLDLDRFVEKYLR